MPALGITGGIATGKSSFTTSLLRCLPAVHFDADRSAHDLLANDPDVREAVLRHFGPESYESNGPPNRGFLRETIFGDAGRRKQLEGILHPAIRKQWMAMAHEMKSGRDWLFVDIPLLFETGAENSFDNIVVVACSPETQHRRLIESRGLTSDLANRIISTQIDLRTKMSKADHLIWNDSSHTCLEGQAVLIANWLRQSHV